MFHNGHQLYSVVAGFLDTGQSVVCEFPIGADLALFLRHADMGFVDIQGGFTLEISVRPGEYLAVVHNLCGEGDGLGILDDPAGIQGNMLSTLQIGIDDSFDLAALPQSVITGQEQFPVAAFQLGQGVTGQVPVVEVAGQVQLIGAGGPLSVEPAAIDMVEAKIPAMMRPATKAKKKP